MNKSFTQVLGSLVAKASAEHIEGLAETQGNRWVYLQESDA